VARASKTLEQMRANPRDWRIEQLETVANAFAVNVRQPRGAHVIFGASGHGDGRIGTGPATDQACLRPRVRGIHRPGEEIMIGDIPYRFTVRPLSADEGGGYLVEFPDLPGCMADGETIDEAITNAQDAMT
jgi:hypothetical protein